MLIIGLLITSLIISQFNPRYSAFLDLAVAVVLLAFTVFSSSGGLFYWAVLMVFSFNCTLFFVTGKPVAYYLR
jgi:hypothetical protein